MLTCRFYRFPSSIHRVLTPFNRTSLFHPFKPIYLCFIKHNQHKNMKATTTLLAAILTLSMNALFASNDGAAVINNMTSSTFIALAPVTPAEATFEEVNDATATTFILAPVSPIEADFSDAISETTIDITTLAPVTPSKADFASDDETTNVSVFAPVTPSVADFSDGI